MTGATDPSSAHALALAAAIDGVGSGEHVEKLTDLIASLVTHDLVTVVRYSVTERPEFVSHRNYTNELVTAYLERYYPYDPFYRQWRELQRPGIVRLAEAPMPYVAEFLVQSVIADEVGVLLEDGPGWCLGVFLDRRRGQFRRAEVARLETLFPVLASLHALDTRTRRPEFRRTQQLPARGQAPRPHPGAGGQAGLWPELSARERDIVSLILAGHPTAGIAEKLGLARGTVKNHRRSIYTKLDITTERELFLQYLNTTEPRS